MAKQERSYNLATLDFTNRLSVALLGAGQIAYLAPQIIEAILAGRQTCDLTLERLLKINTPLEWQAQRQALGF